MLLKRTAAAALDESPILAWTSWGHLGVTLGLAALLFNMWDHQRSENFEEEKAQIVIESRLTKLEEQSRVSRELDKAQADRLTEAIRTLTERVDAQRADIRSLQEVIYRAMQTRQK